MTFIYLFKHVFLLSFLNPPEPMNRMYTRSYFRATWIFSALDAGFFTAMKLRPAWLRDVMSIVFSIGYLLFPEAAEDIGRRNRQNPTIQVIRTAWNKGTNPYLRFFTFADRGFLSIRQDVEIPVSKTPLPSVFDEKRTHVKARLYFHGTKQQLEECEQLIFQIPGGGFVALPPKNHDDYTSQWARMTKLPVISINYGKAPEHPYPFGLEECVEAYKSITESTGSVIGIKNLKKIIVTGDSAGGNLATGLTAKCIENGLAVPHGLVLVYPALSFELECWMNPEYLNLCKTESHVQLYEEFVKNKTKRPIDAPLANNEAPISINVMTDSVDRRASFFERFKPFKTQHTYIHSYLSLTSRMQYFNDRILPPEYMRAMGIMYLADSPIIPDMASDYYISPILIPDTVLAQFPRTYFLCGEKDPLVDDTMILSNRLRECKTKAHAEWERRRAIDKNQQLDHHIFARDPEQMVQVKILPGMSHGFFAMYSVLPEAKQLTKLVGQWFLTLLSDYQLLSDKKLTLDMMKDIAVVDSGVLLQRRRKEMAKRVFKQL
ncbi:Alpha/Beta hydrolase protein [Gorgonomyces haynaldii]|nr:Alpha/Beta hydrolase protein [Gorgonomyces haynaldii]